MNLASAPASTSFKRFENETVYYNRSSLKKNKNKTYLAQNKYLCGNNAAFYIW